MEIIILCMEKVNDGVNNEHSQVYSVLSGWEL